MSKSRHKENQERTILDDITDGTSGESKLEKAQRTNNRKDLDSIYNTALKFFRSLAKECGLTCKTELGFEPSLIDGKEHQRTIMFWAIATHQPKTTIHKLLELGSNTDEKYYLKDFNPLSALSTFFTALKYDNLIAMHALLEKNPELSYKRHMQTATTPANYLVEKDKLRMLQSLLKAYPIVAEIGAGITLLTPLHVAVELDKYDAAKKIVATNKDACNSPDHNGCTPVHTAVIQGKNDFLELLLNANADPNVVTKESYPEYPNKTPLQIAASTGNNEAFRLLLLHGGNLTCENPISIRHLNTAMLTAVKLIDYIAIRTAQGRHTNRITTNLFYYTGYSAGYKKEEKLPVARKALNNILEGKDDPLENLNENEIDILKDGRLKEIVKDFIGQHERFQSSSEDQSDNSNEMDSGSWEGETSHPQYPM